MAAISQSVSQESVSHLRGEAPSLKNPSLTMNLSMVEEKDKKMFKRRSDSMGGSNRRAKQQAKVRVKSAKKFTLHDDQLTHQVYRQPCSSSLDLQTVPDEESDDEKEESADQNDLG